MKTEKSKTFWNNFSSRFDKLSRYSEWRWGSAKRNIFSKATGNTLMIGAGSGNDFPYLPSKCEIIAIDFSPKMLEIANTKKIPSNTQLKLEDVQSLSFKDETFDSAISSCVFCSVPDPVQGLKEVFRVLKPGGSLLMFEHTGSKNIVFQLILKMMNFFPGPDLTRKTAKNVELAGFKIKSINYIFQDIVKTIHAVKER